MTDDEPTESVDCVLCSPGLAPIVGESRHWRLLLNRNQCLLGKCMLVLRRHEEQVAGITADEWAELHEQIRRATAMLVAAFDPEHFNYAFLQNQDRHVHLHIIPRYAAPRKFSGSTFSDLDYPNHYTPDVVRTLTDWQMDNLAGLLSVE
ncbi:MAG: HIT family protein [Chloroflexota bacterium]|nr:HIT family protein [Chloroflexota bacterium]